MVSSYLAYTKATRPTGRSIALELGLRSYGIRRPHQALRLLIRWGSRKLMPPAAIVLNTAQAIARASDKVLAIRTMSAAGINCVPCFDSYDEAVARANGGVVLGRSRHGMGGRDIVPYDGHTEISGFARDHEWFTIYHEPSREMRLHVVNDEVVRVQGKYLDFPEQASANPYVRNYAAGYRFRSPNRELHSRRREQAISAVRALGLHFGAVDMLLFGSERDSMVLEVNTAPACSPLTASAYAKAFSVYLDSQI